MRSIATSPSARADDALVPFSTSSSARRVPAELLRLMPQLISFAPHSMPPPLPLLPTDVRCRLLLDGDGVTSAQSSREARALPLLSDDDAEPRVGGTPETVDETLERTGVSTALQGVRRY